MRAGRMDREITIEAYTSTVDDAGTPTKDWTEFATVRAQLLQQSTEEFLRSYGETDQTVAIFRIRWLEGLTTDHRVVYRGKAHNLREIKEIGRNKGLELRCEEVRS